MTRVRPSLVLVGALLVALGACADAAPDGAAATQTDADAVRVVVTTAVLGDVVTQVLDGTGAEIEVVMPSGVDPHAYEPSASDGLALREADLVVANGLQLETSLLDVLDAAADDGVTVLEVGEQLDTLLEIGAEEPGHADGHGEAGERGDEDEGHDGHDHGALDPHVWLDPLNVARMAEVIATAYADVDEAASETVTGNAAAVASDMEELDAELQALVATLDDDQRKLVTNHDSLGYLAARYDLDVVGTVLPGASTDADTTAAAFTELVVTIREAGVPAIFADTTASDRLAQSLAQEIGDIEVVRLHTGSLGEPGSGAESVSGMIRTNIERIVEALG